MAGNHRSGRSRKTTAAHIENGTYEPGRHGGRCDVGKAEKPSKPRGLTKDASKLWDVVTGWLTKHNQVQLLDSASLEMMCRMWSLTRQALKAAESDPLDKDARIAATGYAQRFEAVSSRFGMTPVDRARLTVQSTDDVKDDKTRLFKVVG